MLSIVEKFKGRITLFELGRVVATSNFMTSTKNADMEIEKALLRHSHCDWGISKDKTANDMSVMNSLKGQDATRIQSVYKAECGKIFWVITEWDRSATTILFPEDY